MTEPNNPHGETFDGLPPVLSAFERSLRSLRPAAGSIESDHLMYLAGQQSVRSPLRSGRGAFLNLAIGAICGGLICTVVTLQITNQTSPRDRIVAANSDPTNALTNRAGKNTTNQNDANVNETHPNSSSPCPSRCAPAPVAPAVRG